MFRMSMQMVGPTLTMQLILPCGMCEQKMPPTSAAECTGRLMSEVQIGEWCPKCGSRTIGWSGNKKWVTRCKMVIAHRRRKEGRTGIPKVTRC